MILIYFQDCESLESEKIIPELRNPYFHFTAKTSYFLFYSYLINFNISHPILGLTCQTTKTASQLVLLPQHCPLFNLFLFQPSYKQLLELTLNGFHNVTTYPPLSQDPVLSFSSPPSQNENQSM